MTAGPLNEGEELLAVHLAELGLPFKREYKYAPGRRFKADFAVWITQSYSGSPHLRQVRPDLPFCLIEVQGGIYSKQAHGSITGILKDNARLFEAFKAGWPMIRFSPDQVKSGEAKRLIEEVLRSSP